MHLHSRPSKSKFLTSA
jgi:protocatechuate 3,4-dioxygenase beta subunit